ncbi:type IV pilus biogenesis protein PilM [Luteitalea sp.]|uniref:type IV pilus biogenesis protein PilM n=1 Tax=Luteitalea sp. TaxID=2004800 RepID=UPI0037CC10DF
MPSLPAWLRTPPPMLGLHVDQHRVTAVHVERDGGMPVIRAVGTSPLPAGAVVPSLTAANVIQRDVLVAAIRQAVDQTGVRTRRVALAIPDTAGKVSLLPFETLPANARDLDQLVRLQLRKTMPFAVEEAQVAWTRGGTLGATTTLVVTAMRRDLVEEYEGACAAAGLHAGTVDLATFNVVNLALLGGASDAVGQGDVLLVHVTPGYASIAVLREGALIFFRTRPADAAEPVADVVHQTRMFYEDRLAGQGFARVLLVAGQDLDDRDALARNLGQLFEAAVTPLSLQGLATFGDRLSPSEGLVGQIAAPAGLVLREGALT